MKYHSPFAFLITLAVIVLCSCSSAKVSYTGHKAEKIQKVALVSTMIGLIDQPVFPLIDAAIFNSKTNSIAYQIMEMQKNEVDSCRAHSANSLAARLNCQVLYADSLQNNPNFSILKKSYDYPYGLDLQMKDYTTVILSKGDISPVKYVRGDVLSYFSRTEDYSPALSDIAQKLDADLVAIAFFNLSTDTEIFGLWGSSFLQTNIFLFNRRGKLVLQARNASSTEMISGDELDDYASHFAYVKILLDEVLAKIEMRKVISQM